MTPGPWRKSSRSGANSPNCVEARLGATGPQIRDSKLGDGSPLLSLSRGDFAALLNSTKLPRYTIAAGSDVRPGRSLHVQTPKPCWPSFSVIAGKARSRGYVLERAGVSAGSCMLAKIGAS